MKLFIIVPDLHFPFQCPRYMALVLRAIKHFKPHGLVQLGDALDWWQLSTYDKDPARKQTIKDDVDEWNATLTLWARHMQRGSTIHLIEGNHENRMTRYVARHAREIHEIVPSLPDLLHLKERNAAGNINFKWHQYKKWNSCRIGATIFSHGYYFNAHTAATNLAKYRCNIVTGHTHRTQYICDGVYFSATLGHGSDENQTAHQPTPTGWQQSLGLFTTGSGSDVLEIYNVENGRAVIRGKAI